MALQHDWKMLALHAAAFAYGLFTLGTFVLLAALSGVLLRKPSDKARQELAAAQNRFWNLQHPPNGLRHRFVTLKDGTKMHYVEVRRTDPAPKNLVVFIHGFPDSWLAWKYLLRSSKLSEGATLVAVDLPGFGGSDDLPSYDADHVLEAVTQFMLEMKARYIHSGDDGSAEKGKTVLVAHDWGALISFRLASEAPQVADRFILSGATIPALAEANVMGRCTTVVQMLRLWKRNPRALRLLKKALVNLAPLLAQLRKSGYIFVFNLPYALVGTFGRVGGARWLYQLTHANSVDPTGRKKLDPDGKEAAELMAMSLGPSVAECSGAIVFGKPLANGVNGSHHSDAADEEQPLAYPAVVRRRAAEQSWSTQIRLYRDGLLNKPWTKSMDTLWQLNQEDHEPAAGGGALLARRRSSANAALFDSGAAGSLRARATVLWGGRDLAGEPRIALHGIEDYLARDSQVVVLPKTGHWMQLEQGGREVVEGLVQWAVDGERVPLAECLGEMQSLGAKVTVER